MKKLFFSVAALAALLLTVSCQQENLEPAAGDGTVTYSVQMPGSLATKAVGDDLAAEYELIYEVYRAAEIDVLDAEPLYEGTAAFSGKVATVQLQFVKRQDYKVLFWAQAKELTLFDTSDLREVSMSDAWDGNDLAAAVFAGTDEVSDCVSAKKGNVTLVRPVSQINIATSNESLTVGGAESGQTSKTITMSDATVTVKGLHTVYNVYSKEVSDAVQDIAFAEAAISKLPAAFNADYKYVAMNYVGFSPAQGTTVDVEFSFETSEGTVSHEVSNVPIKANYRTNILGNLITEENAYTVTIDTQWADNGGDMEFVTDGLIKNVDGAYEVSSDKGLAYAMNNLFAQGGDFYLTESLYNLSGFAVNPPSVPAGVELNIYGEAHVVTRAATTVSGVTIIGITNFIDKVEGSLSISGVTLENGGEQTVLVNDAENGTVVISECVADVIVGDGEVLQADKVTTLEELQAALLSGLKEITISGSINIANGEDVTLDLNGKTVKAVDEATGSYGMFNNRGTLVVNGPGALVLAAENNREWNAYSSVISNNPGGNLTVNEGVVIEHLGGTDMAYGIDNLTNGKGTVAVTTIDGATIKSTYRAIRQFLNGIEATNELYVKAGSVVEGQNKGVWMQDPSAKSNTGKLVVEEGAKVGTVYLYVTPGSTEWPVEVSVAKSALAEDGLITGNVPLQYRIIEENGAYTVKYFYIASNDDELKAVIAKAITSTEPAEIFLTDGTFTDLNLTVAEFGAPKCDLVFKPFEDAKPVITGTVTLGYREQGTGATMWNGNVTFENITFDHAEAENHSLDVHDVKSLTLKKCTVIGDGEYGICSARGNSTGTSKIVECTFENAGMQLLGNFATGLVIDDCTFNESCINVQAGNGVTVQNCNFTNTLTSANVAESFYLVRSNSTPITVKDCKMNIDSDLTEVVAEQAKWGIFWNRGTTNWTVENVAVTMSDAALMQTELFVTKCTSTGAINTNNLTVNGKGYASTAAQLISAVKAGAADIYVQGEFKMPSYTGEATVAITSMGAATIDNTLGSYWEYATLTFNNVDFKTGTGMVNGNGADYAAFYSKNVTYNKCDFSGPMRLGRDGAKFVECTFNDLGNDYVWTYGNAAAFEGCTFNSAGKALLIYSDGGDGAPAVSVTGCTFNATQGAKAGAIANQNCAAVEIHNYGRGVDLSVSGNTVDTEFSGVWRIKTYEIRQNSPVSVNGTEYTTIALDGKTMTIDSNKNVTVNE